MPNVEIVIEHCVMEVHPEQGVIYVTAQLERPHPETLLCVSGLTPEQCKQERIDVRAAQRMRLRRWLGPMWQVFVGVLLGIAMGLGMRLGH